MKNISYDLDLLKFRNDIVERLRKEVNSSLKTFLKKDQELLTLKHITLSKALESKSLTQWLIFIQKQDQETISLLRKSCKHEEKQRWLEALLAYLFGVLSSTLALVGLM